MRASNRQKGEIREMSNSSHNNDLQHSADIFIKNSKVIFSNFNSITLAKLYALSSMDSSSCS